MGQNKGVFDPNSGRGVSMDEAQAIISGRRTQGVGAGDAGPVQSTMPMVLFDNPNPNQKDVQFDLPPMEPEVAQQIMAAVPQVVALVGSMHPALRGVKAAMLVPAVTKGLIDVVVNGKDFDINSIAEEAVLGLAGHGVGALGSAASKAGTSVVRRALDLGGSGYLNETAEKVLPKIAIQENAKMTPEGAQAMFDKFKSTGAHIYEDLGNVLQQAGLKSRNTPNISGGGLTSIIGAKLLPPETQLEIGKTLAEPAFGISSESIGRGAETALRSLMAYIQSQTRAGEPSGPQRRPIQ